MKTQLVLSARREDYLFSLDDQQLILTYQRQGDQRCLEELLKRYVPFIQRICRKYLSVQDSEEMCMRILEKLLYHLNEIDAQCFTLWLHRLCRNECLMELRRRRRRHRALQHFNSVRLKTCQSLGQEGDDHSADKRARQILKAMERLPRAQRECLEMFYFQQRSYQQICHSRNCSYKEVKSHLQNGRRNLRRMLQEGVD